MVGLVDILLLKKKIPVAGTEVEVSGISARRIAALLDRFPDLRKMFANRQIDPDSIMRLAPDIIAAIIAEGTLAKVSGESDEVRAERVRKEEEAAGELGLGDQLDLVSEIVLVTFPGGFGPLVKRLEQLGLGAASAAPESPRPTAAQASRLPAAFRDSFNSGGTPSKPSGTTAPDSLPPGSS